MALYEFKGKRPRITGGAWVAPSADLIGDVEVGVAATILFGVVIRADNSPIRIGSGSNIQDGSVLHSDDDVPLTIGSHVTVGHKAILHGCTIEDEVLVGMGSTILNHAVIGTGSLVGANALVTEGKVFPPGSLILGSPAKVVRPLTDAERASIRNSAASYVTRGAELMTGLNQVSGPE